MKIKFSSLTVRYLIIPIILCVEFVSPSVYASSEVIPNVQNYFRAPTGFGSAIVFESNGKLWKSSTDSTVARRVTSSSLKESSPVFSPDGAHIAYTASDGLVIEVFIVPRDSDVVKRLTFDGGSNVKVQGWLNDTEVLYSTTIKSKKRGPLLYSVNMETLESRPIPLAEASEGCILDELFIFTRNEELADSTRLYNGGYAQSIYKIKLSLLNSSASTFDSVNEPTTELTGSYDGTSRNPVCTERGVYFLSDRSGRYNIWSLNLSDGALMQHTFYEDYDIKSISLLNGSQILFQKLGAIFSYDINSKTTVALDMSIPKHAVSNFEDWTFNIDHSTEYQISNGSNIVITVTRGKLFKVDLATKSAYCLECRSSVRVRSPQILADSKTVLALTDATGEYSIYKYELNSPTPPVEITHDIQESILDIFASPNNKDILARTISGNLYHVDTYLGITKKLELSTISQPEEISWSNDGRYAVFITYTPQDIGRLTLFDIECHSTQYLTSGRYEVSSPVFSQDMEHIFYLSETNFRSSLIDTWGPTNYWPVIQNKTLVYSYSLNQALSGKSKGSAKCPYETKVNSHDRSKRLLSLELPFTAANYNSLLVSGEMVYGLSKRELRSRLAKLIQFSLEKNDYRDAGTPTFSFEIYNYKASQDKLSLIAKSSSGLFVSRMTIQGQFGNPQFLNNIEGPDLKIDLRLEREQMFDEVWRLYRDYFWDPDMSGVDWDGVREKYKKFISNTSNRDEFNELVSYMIAELGAGHTTLGVPDNSTVNRWSVGKLGGELIINGGIHISEIYDGDLDMVDERSPLSKAVPSIDIGDKITHVNDVPVFSLNALDQELSGRVGKPTSISVVKQSGRKVNNEIVPISAAHEAWLRYKHWVFTNQEFVERESNNSIGYIHLNASFEPDFADFIKQYSYFHDRQALILDLRGNNGGNLDPWILNFLQRRTWVNIMDRYRSIPMKHPKDSFDGLLVVLIDGDTYSDGELIAEGIRQLGLGVLIGTRTSGAGKWVNNEKTLIDGGRVRIPQAGSYITKNGRSRWIVEGRGVSPDILVDNDSYLFYHGLDKQLQFAIKYSMGNTIHAP
ncbi:PD40 domain-containing protein [Vibrio navarrensis]